ncbi:MAG: hypothetical protein PWQ70_575 [Clostridiales bacterium]|jgi:hypothetical protein|nr:hypothetical protein [Clostridiales bacterium]
MVLLFYDSLKKWLKVVDKMKNTWKHIFWTIFTLTLFLLIILPLALRVQLFKCFIAFWIEPIKEYVSAYTTLIGAFLGSILTISGAMWQSERSVNLAKKNLELKGLQRIRDELIMNSEILKTYIEYMEVNNIKEIYFYPQDEEEFWVLNNDESKKVKCDNNKGILNIKLSCKNDVFLADVVIYSKRNMLIEQYEFFNKLNYSNGFTYESIKEVLKNVEDIIQIVDQYI